MRLVAQQLCKIFDKYHIWHTKFFDRKTDRLVWFGMTSDLVAPKHTRRRDADATIVSLKAAATQLLVQDGLSKLSIAPILQQAGVSRGALFHHFPTKNHLIAAAFAGLLEDAADKLHALGRQLRHGGISVPEFVAGVRAVFCSDMFVGSIEIAIAIRVDHKMLTLVQDVLDAWWTALAHFWHGTFDLPGLSEEDAAQHWIMASNLLRGHAFSSSYRGSPNRAEPFCASFERMILGPATVRAAT